MLAKFQHHLAIAFQAALVAFNKSLRHGEELQQILGYTDTLTGIPNRKSFEEDRKDIHVFDTFILVDVDNLKQINDTFGHLFGDEILCCCAWILSKATERVGKAYRIAGDEFALIIPQCWVKTVCLYIKSRIKEDARFSISIGIAPVCGPDGLTDKLFSAAETAMYKNKHRKPDIYSEYLTDSTENDNTPPSSLSAQWFFATSDATVSMM